VIDSRTETVTKSGKLILYFTGLNDGVMAMDSCTGTLKEGGKLIACFVGVGL
jgi:hypothetical protein